MSYEPSELERYWMERWEGAGYIPCWPIAHLAEDFIVVYRPLDGDEYRDELHRLVTEYGMTWEEFCVANLSPPRDGVPWERYWGCLKVVFRAMVADWNVTDDDHNPLPVADRYIEELGVVMVKEMVDGVLKEWHSGEGRKERRGKKR